MAWMGGIGPDDRFMEDVDAFSKVMQGLWVTSDSLAYGYEEACQEVYDIVNKEMEEVTREDWEFIWAVSKDLSAWSKALQLVLECSGFPEAEMESWVAQALSTGL